MGVAEDVNITFLPASATVNWSVASADGSVSGTPGVNPVYTAPNAPKASDPAAVLKASFYSMVKDTSFTVVAPTLVYIDKRSDSPPPTQLRDKLEIKDKADWYIGPEDVNFSKVKIVEGPCNANPQTGYFATKFWLKSMPHTYNPTPPPVTDTLVPGKGWQVPTIDTVSTGTCFDWDAGPFSDGGFTWPIPWSYVIGSTSIGFATVNHVVGMSMPVPMVKWHLTLSKMQLSDSATQF